nr:reverse transcriptase domain-containing protein [Tanacetum cinerariifolium]
MSCEATSPDNHMSAVDRRLNIMSGGGTSSKKATLDESALAKELKIWDVSVVTGRYLSTDMVVSDAQARVRYFDVTTHVVMVMFDETTSELVKCSVDSPAQSDEEVFQFHIKPWAQQPNNALIVVQTCGKVRLSKFHDAPPPLNRSLDYTDPTTLKFRDKIRVYNSMFCFTSFGARIDHSINKGRAPYTFRINGQNYHCIGSLHPKEGIEPSTRSSAGNLFPPLDIPELTIRRRSRADPTFLNDFEMVVEGNGDLPLPDLQTMEELCQPSLNGRGGTFMKRHPKECYDLIENITAHHNDWDTLVQRSESSSFITSSFDPEIIALKAEMTETSILNSELVVAPIIEPVVALVSAPKPNQKPLILYPSRLHDRKLRDKANDQKEKFFQIFKDLNFNISFADTLILMPKFGPTIKTLLTNKDKLSDLARTPLNKHCLMVLLKKFLEKLGGPGKFLIPCDFSGMDECLALADLGASINLMPLSVWNKLSLPELSPTCMTLELVDRSISRPVGVAEDVFIKTRRALIDVFEELTLHVGKEAITFNLYQTSRYSANYNDMTTNRIDVIDMDCEEYSQEVLGFFDVIASGNPTPYYDPIVSTSSSTLIPFRDSDFLLEEVDAFLALEDDPTSPEVDHSYFNTERGIILLKSFLNDDPSLPPPNQGNYLPQVRKKLKICEAKTDKSSIDEPLEVELKDLPPHLKYAFLEGDDKFPVIIAKYLTDEEKIALITVLKSHKRAIAWKLSDIRGINPEFCTHKILMEEDLKPVVQH